MNTCVWDKTFTSEHVESSFENPYVDVWWCIFKAIGGTLRNELGDEVMWRHLTNSHVIEENRNQNNVKATSST